MRAVVALVVAVVLLVACGSSASKGSDSQPSTADAPNLPVLPIDGYSAITVQCDDTGHRVYASFNHDDGNVSIFVINDPTCNQDSSSSSTTTPDTLVPGGG